MGQDDQGKLHDISDGGVAGAHKAPSPFKILAAPATDDETNNVVFALKPIGCFRVDDIRFAFNSSFLAGNIADPSKDIRAEIKMLLNLLEVFPNSPLSVFGHADPVGNDDYNKALSGRRATVVYALLISRSDPGTAVALWKQVAKEEQWGKTQRAAMEEFTGLPQGTADDALLTTYIQQLTPPNLKLGKQDFLAQGADKEGKGDYQGCSEFNPVLILSKEKTDAFTRTHDEVGRNDANSRNRRVLILLFPKGSKVDPKLWPCPSVKGPGSVCKTRFWIGPPKGEERRSRQDPDTDRVIEKDKEMYACRFYHRKVIDSPCEEPVIFVRVRLFDAQARPLPFAAVVVKSPDGTLKADRASGAPPAPAGTTPANQPNTSLNESPEDRETAYITLRLRTLPATVTLWWSRAKRTETTANPLPIVGTEFENDYKFEFRSDLNISFPEDDQAASPLRLGNLGYVIPDPKQPAQTLIVQGTRNFQHDYKPKFGDITEDGTFNQPTVDALRVTHDTADLLLKLSSQVQIKR